MIKDTVIFLEEMEKIFKEHEDDIIIKEFIIPREIFEKMNIRHEEFKPKHLLDLPPGIRVSIVPSGDEIVVNTNKGMMPLRCLKGDK